MRLYLIRHGETAYNATGLVQGHGEIPLNDMGIRQAALLGQRLAKTPPDVIYASDIRRATMTAGVVGAFTGAPIEYDPGYRERDPGPELTNKTHEEAIAFFTDMEFEPVGGESVWVFAERIEKAFANLIANEGDNDRTVAVVSHGMVCGAFMRVCLGYTLEQTVEMSWPNTCLSIVDYKDGEWMPSLLGCAAHLEDAQPTGQHSTGA